MVWVLMFHLKSGSNSICMADLTPTAAAGISRVSPILEDQRYQHFARRFLNVGGLPGRGGEENHLRA